MSGDNTYSCLTVTLAIPHQPTSCSLHLSKYPCNLPQNNLNNPRSGNVFGKYVQLDQFIPFIGNPMFSQLLSTCQHIYLLNDSQILHAKENDNSDFFRIMLCTLRTVVRIYVF